MRYYYRELLAIVGFSRKDNYQLIDRQTNTTIGTASKLEYAIKIIDALNSTEN
jgi:hypothetical protein